ncbi:MAG: acetyl-CoA carboxylase biotin carboxyl carrier protein [Sphingobacteriales bacterium]|jgi:acetyl-CoA carboxylase biotin carboxyl carrier protein
MLDLKEIQDLIKFVSKSGVGEVALEKDDFKITIKAKKERKETTEMFYQSPQAMQSMPAGQVASTESAPAAASDTASAAPVDDDSKYVAIKSPMIGTFYRSSSPDKDSFVNVGDTIKPGDVVCVIEAMKLFNEIESEISGKVVKVIIDNASPVEYDQTLILVDPS